MNGNRCSVVHRKTGKVEKTSRTASISGFVDVVFHPTLIDILKF